MPARPVRRLSRVVQVDFARAIAPGARGGDHRTGRIALQGVQELAADEATRAGDQDGSDDTVSFHTCRIVALIDTGESPPNGKPRNARQVPALRACCEERTMRIDLSGRTAVVTGSTAGIGLAIAKGLAEAGAAVTVNGRTQARVDSAKAAIRSHVPGAVVGGIAADLATAEGATAFVRQVPSTDILVNNMGIFEQTPFPDITDADWQRFFDTNVMSGVRMSRAYLPAMVAQGWGRVVFISSESGLNIPKAMIHYGMTKTAQLAISRGLAESVANTGVTVNAVLPGRPCPRAWPPCWVRRTRKPPGASSWPNTGRPR